VHVKPTFGIETVGTYDGSPTAQAALKTPPVYVVFEGPDWTGGVGVTGNATPLAQAAQRILRSTYLSKLSQYGFRGLANAATLDRDWWVDNPAMPIDKDSSDAADATYLDDLVQRKGISVSTDPAQRPIFVIVRHVAPESSIGWNKPGPPLSNGALSQLVFVDLPAPSPGTPEKDGFTDLFSHEMADRISNDIKVIYPRYSQENPNPMPWLFGTTAKDPDSLQIGHQVADGEADFSRYTFQDDDGDVVQAYWSDADQAFVIPNASDLSGYAHWSFPMDATGQPRVDARGVPLPGSVESGVDPASGKAGVKLFPTPQPVTPS
jgi:hypothetical protein